MRDGISTLPIALLMIGLLLICLSMWMIAGQLDFHFMAWKCTRHVASYFDYLRIQDAPQKCWQQSSEPGAWAGSIVHSSNGLVTVMISLEHWLKARDMLH